MNFHIDYFGTVFKNLFFNRFRNLMTIENRHVTVDNHVQTYLEITAHISCSNAMGLKDGRMAL